MINRKSSGRARSFLTPRFCGRSDVCSRMLTYAHVCSRMLTYAYVCSRMLTCAHVCSHMRTYADVCGRMQARYNLAMQEKREGKLQAAQALLEQARMLTYADLC